MTGVPSNIIIPFVGVEFDSSAAFSGPAQLPVKGLLIGQKIAAGTGTAEAVTLITSDDQVLTEGGEGSQIHKMAERWFANNSTTATYMIMLDDAGASTAATHTITISGTATAAGAVVFYIDDVRISVAVAVGDDLDDVGAAAVIAINLKTGLPCTAAYAAGTLTLTMKNKGLAAGDLDYRLNATAGEENPAGISCAVGTTTPGATDPDLQDAIDAIGEEWFNIIAQPYDDTTNMGVMETYLDTAAGPMEQKDGVCYQAKRDTLANMITFATASARNSQFMVLLPSYKRREQTCQLAAGVAAQTAKSIESDPGQPLHRMTLAGFTPLDAGDKWTNTERNQLVTNGVATLTDEVGVQTEGTVTMYLKNSAAAADVAYQYQNTMFILMTLRYRFVVQIKTKYPRARLGNNADNIKPGLAIMTPKRGEAEAVIWFKSAERDGLVEGLDDFKNNLSVERDSSNVNRMNWLLPPDLINQFIVGSGILQFRLES